MFKILQKLRLNPQTNLFVVEAAKVAKKWQPGQFVIIRVNETGERVPLTIIDADYYKGTITMAVQSIGKTTKLLNSLGAADYIKDIVGPLGKPTEIKKYGVVVIICGGVGAAEALPVAKALKAAADNYIISIIGARSYELLIFEAELKAISDELYITTDDGSYGRKGLVSDILSELIRANRQIDLVYAVGPVPMMKAVSELSYPRGIKTLVCLNPIMVDGTGMCGSCRILYYNKVKFACVDGPEFDADGVDFDNLMQRLRIYSEQEQMADRKFMQQM